MIKIGITGGIGSGKSTVTEILKVMGYAVYNSDLRAAFLMQNDRSIVDEIAHCFGPDSLSENGLPDRKKLAAIVFKDEQSLEKLNSIIHPAVHKDFLSWIEQQKGGIVFKESAIIFEHGLEKNLDQVWLVEAPVELRISRVMKRGLSRDEVISRMEMQLSSEIAHAKTHSIIENDEKVALIPQILNMIKKTISA
jgi:dephospho-CoA kinase